MMLRASGSRPCSRAICAFVRLCVLYGRYKSSSVFKSYFPFRASTDSNGVSTYSFTSKNARDNVYFTWDNLTPKKVNYGAGTSYGVQDALTNFGGSSNGYGIFPFNNTSNTSSGKGTKPQLPYFSIMAF